MSDINAQVYAAQEKIEMVLSLIDDHLGFDVLMSEDPKVVKALNKAYAQLVKASNRLDRHLEVEVE